MPEPHHHQVDFKSLPPTQLYSAAEGCVIKAIDHVQKAFQIQLETPTIRFDLRGRSAGQFRYIKANSKAGRLANRTMVDQTLRFNPEILRQYTQPFFEVVIPHEVAHFAAYNVFGTSIKPHGKEWKSIMLDVFQVPPKVTHSFELVNSARVSKTYPYVCACPEATSHHQLGAIRHKRVMTQAAQYRCKRCHQVLRFNPESA